MTENLLLGDEPNEEEGYTIQTVFLGRYIRSSPVCWICGQEVKDDRVIVLKFQGRTVCNFHMRCAAELLSSYRREKE